MYQDKFVLRWMPPVEGCRSAANFAVQFWNPFTERHEFMCSGLGTPNAAAVSLQELRSNTNLRGCLWTFKKDAGSYVLIENLYRTGTSGSKHLVGKGYLEFDNTGVKKAVLTSNEDRANFHIEGANGQSCDPMFYENTQPPVQADPKVVKDQSGASLANLLVGMLSIATGTTHTTTTTTATVV